MHLNDDEDEIDQYNQESMDNGQNSTDSFERRGKNSHSIKQFLRKDVSEENNKSNISSETRATGPTYFHYKRWIWVIFPLASMSVKDGLPFSYLISRCFETATRYISVEEEFQLSKDTLTTAAAFKRRINVLLYQSEKKSKLKKIETVKKSSHEVLSEEEVRQKESFLSKRKPNNPMELHKIVKELHQKRQERIVNFNLNMDDTRDPINSSNILDNTSRKDPEDSLQKNSLIYEKSNFKNSSKYFLRKHKKTPSEAEARDEESSRFDKNQSIQDMKAKLPLLKIDISKNQDSSNRRQSISSRIRGFGEFRGPQGSSIDLSSRKDTIKENIQQHLDASLRRLSAARQKVASVNKSIAALHCRLKGSQKVSEGLAVLNSFGQSSSSLEQKVLKKTVDLKIAEFNKLSKEK